MARMTGTPCLRLLSVDRMSRVPLGDQVVAALKAYIQKGDFAIGDILPGFRQLAASAGVSEKVVRQALRRLAHDGWLRLRRGVGSEVLDPTRGRGTGRVLYLNSDFGLGYYAALLASSVRREIEDVGYVFEETFAFDGLNRFRGDFIKKRLAERWDLVIEHTPKPQSRQMLIASGLPFVTLEENRHVGSQPVQHCLGHGFIDMSKGLPDFIRAVARRNVKRVLQVMYGHGPFDISEMLRAFGVMVETLSVPLVRTHDRTTESSYRIMTRYLARHTLPDLIFVSDDSVAQPVLMALGERSIRIPEDVSFVSLVNRGIGVVSSRPLTRLEMDPVGFGTQIGHAVVRYFRTGRFDSLQLGSVYVQGETF